ncbi:TPA: hypothetical protein U8251_002133 [Pseudomonas putida]|nr:hypothetical protein [Pseudomonas putida]
MKSYNKTLIWKDALVVHPLFMGDGGEQRFSAPGEATGFMALGLGALSVLSAF